MCLVLDYPDSSAILVWCISSKFIVSRERMSQINCLVVLLTGRDIHLWTWPATVDQAAGSWHRIGKADIDVTKFIAMLHTTYHSRQDYYLEGVLY
jgi:hypothetical protein